MQDQVWFTLTGHERFSVVLVKGVAASFAWRPGSVPKMCAEHFACPTKVTSDLKSHRAFGTLSGANRSYHDRVGKPNLNLAELDLTERGAVPCTRNGNSTFARSFKKSFRVVPFRGKENRTE